MKNSINILLIGAFLLVAKTTLQAQEYWPRNALRLNTFRLLTRSTDIQYERFLGNSRHSLAAGAGFQTFPFRFFPRYAYNRKGYSQMLSAEYHFYFIRIDSEGKNHNSSLQGNGAYIGAYYRYHHLREYILYYQHSPGNPEYRVVDRNAYGLVLGYVFSISGNLSCELYAGTGPKSLSKPGAWLMNRVQQTDILSMHSYELAYVKGNDIYTGVRIGLRF